MQNKLTLLKRTLLKTAEWRTYVTLPSL